MGDDLSASNQDAVLGRRLGPYVLRRKIASGGMGTVYDAYHERLEREVALKTLHPGQEASHEDLARFLNEARAAARLNHPNVVPVFDVGEDAGVRYLAMELVRGRSLYDRLRNEGPLEPREALEIVAAACDGLQHAHDKGILHRDLKPANVLLHAPSGTPRITDFGVARAPGNKRLTATGIALGTPNYMSPEQAMGKNDGLDARSDVWGMGAILYELLTGLPPFNKASQLETMQAVVGEALVSPLVHRPELPEDVVAIVVRCLRKPRELRYPSAFELGEDLRRSLRGERVAALGEAPRGARHLLFALVTTVFLALILVSFLSGVFVGKRQETTSSSATPTPAALALAPPDYLAEVAARLEAAGDDAALATVERSLSGAAYLEAARAAGVAPAASSDLFRSVAGPLLSEVRWRRAERGPAERRHAQLASAAASAPASPAARRAWFALAEDLRAQGERGQQGALRLAGELYRGLAEGDEALAKQAAGRAAQIAANELDFATAARLLELSEPSPATLLAREFALGLGSDAPLEGTQNLVARSDLGPCLISAGEGEIRVRGGSKELLLTWRGTPSGLAAVDLTGDGIDELFVTQTGSNSATLSLFSLKFQDPAPFKHLGVFAGISYALAGGRLDPEAGHGDLLVVADQALKTSILNLGANGQPQSRPLFLPGEAPAGHWHLGLLADLDSSPGDEVVLAGAHDAAHAVDSETRQLSIRKMNPEGPGSSLVARIEVGEVEDLALAPPGVLVAVSAGPRGAGVSLVGRGPDGLPALLGHWPLAEEGAKHVRAAYFLTSSGTPLVLRAHASEAHWNLDICPLETILAGAPRGQRLARTPFASRRGISIVAGEADGDPGHELVIGARVYGYAGAPAAGAPPEGPRAPRAEAPDLDASAAFSALRWLEGRAAGEALLSARGTLASAEGTEAHLRWQALGADQAKAWRAEARQAFEVRDALKGRAAITKAEALDRDLGESAERVLAGSARPEQRWRVRQGGLEAAERLRDWSLAGRLLRGLTHAERSSGGEAYASWNARVRAWSRLQPQAFQLSDATLPFGVSHPYRARFSDEGVTIGLDPHAEEAVFAALTLGPCHTLNFEAELELMGGVSGGFVQCGLIEKSATSSRVTGFELWLYNRDSHTERFGYLRFLIGGASASEWIELQALRGRLEVKVALSTGPEGLESWGEVRSNGELVYQGTQRTTTSEQIPQSAYLGLISTANSSLYREDERWARRGWIGLRKLALGTPRSAQLSAPPEPQASHGLVARGQYTAAVTALDAYLLSSPEAGSRATALRARALAKSRLGRLDEALTDLEQATDASPLRALWWLELLGPELARAEVPLIEGFLNRMATAPNPLGVAIAGSLRGDLWSPLPTQPQRPNNAGVLQYLGYRQAELSPQERYASWQAYQRLLGHAAALLPWERFPSILAPRSTPLGEADYRALLETKGTPLRRYAALSQAAAGRPDLLAPRLELARLFRAEGLLGEAESLLQGALTSLGEEVSERGPLEVELAEVLEGLGELPQAAKLLERAARRGSPRGGWAERFPRLSADPRYQKLFR